jgi:hypothetical protein
MTAIGPAHVAAGFIAGAALNGSATAASGFGGRDGDISPWVFVPAAVGITALSGGIMFGGRLAPTNPMAAAALFATGVGAASGFLFGLPVAVHIAQTRG